MSQSDSPQPTEIKLRSRSKLLDISFANGENFSLPCEYLRVFSPSAEVKGHGPGQEVLVTDKQAVGIIEVEPVGQYAIRLFFDDGHNTGLYSFAYLYKLGCEQQENWQKYQDRLRAAGIHSDQEPM